jgi:hypothetical protein
MQMRDVIGAMEANRLRNLVQAHVTAHKRRTLTEDEFEKWMMA